MSQRPHPYSPLPFLLLVSRMPKWNQQQQQQRQCSLLACPLFWQRAFFLSFLLSFIYLSCYLTFFCAVDLLQELSTEESMQSRIEKWAQGVLREFIKLPFFSIYIRSLNSMKNAKTLHSKMAINLGSTVSRYSGMLSPAYTHCSLCLHHKHRYHAPLHNLFLDREWDPYRIF